MSAKKNTNKSIFVSSTFRDMQAERDLLRDFVLPRVNEFAAQYGRAVEIIDLRWGVDTASVSEAEQNHKVLRTCLDEIERSRPFFLGLIGDRYGWTPPHPDMQAALEAARFSLDNLDKSVTALEIEYGVLRSENPPVCLFYFRESPDYSGLPEELRRIYRDEAEGLEKLAKLKETIRARFKADIKNYTAEVYEKGLSVSKDWADMVAGDIIAKLREEWGGPADTPPDWKEQEREMQEAFRESRTAHFAGRTSAIADMTAFCLGGETTPRILMLQGEAGSGKSGLLCKVMDEIEDRCLLLPFSCGISARSSLVGNMLHYFISLICEKLAFEDDSESITKFQDLKDRFMELLFTACRKKWVVAVVDAVDQLSPCDEARRMLWISGLLPENFRLLCSIIDGPETEAVKQSGGEIIPMPPIDTADEESIIHGIAARHHKQIAGAVVEHILKKQTSDGAQAAQNPLYLSLITQNLVMMDRYELDTVQQYMEGGMSQPKALAKFMAGRIDEIPGDAEGAYLAILDRLENLIGRDFVRGVCGLIAVSRGGLRESDMENAFRELGMAFNPADFAWLRQMLRGHVSQGDMQQWDFSHQSLRRALRKDRPEELKYLNNGLVVYFQKIMELKRLTKGHAVHSVIQDDFAAREIMHHICAADRPDIAAGVIAAYFDYYNAALERGLADIYTDREDGPEFLMKIPDSAKNVEETELWCITECIRNFLPLLPEKTRPFRIELMKAALAMIEEREDAAAQMVAATGNIAVSDLYKEIGEGEKAEAYLRKSLDVFKKLYEQSGAEIALRGLLVSYNNMGDYLTTTGQIKDAGEYYQKSLEGFKEIYEKTGAVDALKDISQLYSNMGKFLTAMGQTEEAGEYYQKSLDTRKQIYEQTGAVDALNDLSLSYSNMGKYLTAMGQTEDAGKYYQKAVDAFKQIFDQTGTVDALNDLSLSYSNMGDYLAAMGQTEDAGKYYQRAVDMNKQIYDQTGTISSLRCLLESYDNMGKYLTALGRRKEAAEYYRDLLDAAQTLYNQDRTAAALRTLSASYNSMGNFQLSLGNMEEAGEYYRKSLDTNKQIYDQSGTAAALKDLWSALHNMGTHLMMLNRADEAGEYYQKSLDAGKRLYEQTGSVDALMDLSSSYERIGSNLIMLNRNDEAGEFYQKFIDTAKQIYDQTGTVDALRNLSFSYERNGDLLAMQGRKEEAREYYRKAIETREQIYDQTGTITALRELSRFYSNMGERLKLLTDTEEACEYYQKSLDVQKQLYDQDGTKEMLKDLAVSYVKMGDILMATDQAEKAGECYKNALLSQEQLYEQNKTAQALWDVIVSYDKLGDNKYLLELYEEARALRLKALELFEQYIEFDQSRQKYGEYFREKVIKSGKRVKELEEFFQKQIEVFEVTPAKYRIDFPMYKVDGGMYKIFLINEKGLFYLSDEGATIAELDNIFDLDQPDVIKNLVAILKQYDCRKMDNSIVIECSPKDIHLKMSHLIQAISFMLSMKIFYV